MFKLKEIEMKSIIPNAFLLKLALKNIHLLIILTFMFCLFQENISFSLETPTDMDKCGPLSYAEKAQDIADVALVVSLLMRKYGY